MNQASDNVSFFGEHKHLKQGHPDLADSWCKELV